MFCQNNLSVWFWSQQRERKNIISFGLILGENSDYLSVNSTFFAKIAGSVTLSSI